MSDAAEPLKGCRVRAKGKLAEVFGRLSGHRLGGGKTCRRLSQYVLWSAICFFRVFARECNGCVFCTAVLCYSRTLSSPAMLDFGSLLLIWRYA